MNNVHETGARLGGISRATVYRLWKSGELGSVKVGGKLRFSTDKQIVEYIERLEAAGGDAA